MPSVPVDVGWTPGALVSLVQTVATVLIGGGGLYGIARAVAILWKMANERAKQDDDRDKDIRREMADFSKLMQARVEKLEVDLREERKRCDEELAEVRKLHAEEMANQRRAAEDGMRVLRDEISGLHKQMIQMQRSTAATRIMPTMPEPPQPTSLDSDAIGQALRDTFRLPGVGE